MQKVSQINRFIARFTNVVDDLLLRRWYFLISCLMELINGLLKLYNNRHAKNTSGAWGEDNDRAIKYKDGD